MLKSYRHCLILECRAKPKERVTVECFTEDDLVVSAGYCQKCEQRRLKSVDVTCDHRPTNLQKKKQETFQRILLIYLQMDNSSLLGTE